MTKRITMRQFHEAAGVEDWRVLGEGACTYFLTGSFAAGARLVHEISELAGLGAHHPDVDLRYEGVTVRLITMTPDYSGLSQGDLELARQISAVARQLGARDRDQGGEELSDPHGRGAQFWFQKLEAPRPQRNRIHIDVWGPYDQAEARVAAAIAAGGRLVTAKYVDPGRRRGQRGRRVHLAGPKPPRELNS